MKDMRERFEKFLSSDNSMLFPNGIEDLDLTPSEKKDLLGSNDSFFGIAPSPNYLFYSYLASLKIKLENHFSHQRDFLKASNLLIADSLVQLELMNFVVSFYRFLELKFRDDMALLNPSLFSDWSYVTTVISEYLPIFCENYGVEPEDFCAAYDKHKVESYLYLICRIFRFDTFYSLPLRQDE